MRPIDEYLDEKTMMDLAAAKDFLDGASAAEHGSVRILEHDDQHLKAEVDDTDVYVAELHLNADQLAWSCSCGQASERLIANAFVDPAERTGKWWFSLDEVDGELVIPTGRNPQKICRQYPLQP